MALLLTESRCTIGLASVSVLHGATPPLCSEPLNHIAYTHRRSMPATRQTLHSSSMRSHFTPRPSYFNSHTSVVFFAPSPMIHFSLFSLLGALVLSLHVTGVAADVSVTPYLDPICTMRANAVPTINDPSLAVYSSTDPSHAQLLRCISYTTSNGFSAEAPQWLFVSCNQQGLQWHEWYEISHCLDSSSICCPAHAHSSTKICSPNPCAVSLQGTIPSTTRARPALLVTHPMFL